MSLRRTPLGPGEKSLARGSTFASRGSGLQRRTEIPRSGPLPRTAKSSKPKRRVISPASSEQRRKVRDAKCLACPSMVVDPAHVVGRSLGGCDDPRCVVPLCRSCHDAYDEGTLDLAPHLVGKVPELQHALTHVDGSLLRLVRIVTGKRHIPAAEA